LIIIKGAPRSSTISVVKGLRLKKIGNELLTVLGGRAIYPITSPSAASPRSKPVRRDGIHLKWQLALTFVIEEIARERKSTRACLAMSRAERHANR